jgi:pyruvate formate lyase activating enzyme
MKEAMLYQRLADGRVQCQLCAHRCRIADGARGLCGVRENRQGTLYSLVYGQLVSCAADPIEKKPLFHFLPGSRALSVATVGCNLTCSFCQNADISQYPRGHAAVSGRYTAPEAVVQAAAEHECLSIAYTYTEPTVFFETTYDIARLAHAQGLASVYVSNGYMSSEMLDLICWADAPPLIDAANIDLKSFRDAFYRRQCGATLQPVLDNLKTLVARGVWVEVTTLVIPELNDSDEELGDIAAFVRDELGPETPWHVSRFHPTYRLMDRLPTPIETVQRAWEIGRAAGLHYVYQGNVPSGAGEDTHCPQCGAPVVRRSGFTVRELALAHGACAVCGAAIAGVWRWPRSAG